MSFIEDEEERRRKRRKKQLSPPVRKKFPKLKETVPQKSKSIKGDSAIEAIQASRMETAMQDDIRLGLAKNQQRTVSNDDSIVTVGNYKNADYTRISDVPGKKRTPGYAIDTPDDQGPFQPSTPCVPATIGYTTLTMGLGEQQTFTVVGGNPACPYTWTTNRGSISPEGVFTAPVTNPYCVNNATITLSYKGAVQDSVTIGVTYSANDCATAFFSFGGFDGTYNPWGCDPDLDTGFCCYLYINCLGEATTVAECAISSSVFCTAYWPTYNVTNAFGTGCFSTDCPPGPIDVRSESMKFNGCCPEQSVGI